MKRRILVVRKTNLPRQDVFGAGDKLERLVQNTESMGNHLKELVIFKKIRRMGTKSRTFFVLVVVSAVILYWRGLWALYDLFFEYTLPKHRILSAAISLVVGAAVLLGTGKLISALGPPQIEEEIEEDLEFESEKH